MKKETGNIDIVKNQKILLGKFEVYMLLVKVSFLIIDH